MDNRRVGKPEDSSDDGQFAPTVNMAPHAQFPGDAAPDVADSADLLEPGHEILGRYRIVRLLGRGSMGAVYLGNDQTLESQVAIKIPNRQRFVSAEQLDRFLEDDARMGAQFRKHPGFVSVYDAGRDTDGVPFMVMEYVSGEALSALLKRETKLPPAQAAQLLSAVAEALHYAHRLGFYHCDLKPENILLDEEGRPKIADFGIAVHESVQKQHAGKISGTPLYMSPEQFRGERHRLDGRTDIWSLGVILYESITGCRPFAATGTASYGEIKDEVLHKLPKPPRMIDDTTPPSLERICLKCLAGEIQDRYTTAADLARDLRRAMQPQRQRLFLLLGITAALTGLAIGAWIFGNGGAGKTKRPSGAGAALPSTPPPPLDGSIDVLVWDPNNSARQGLLLSHPGALPLRPGDCVRVRARLNRPAYLYMIWIDSQGVASPVYPWAPGRWTSPRSQVPRSELGLPETADEAWPMQGSPGMETVLLLARETPLPAEFDLQQLLSDLPEQPKQAADSLVWFADGRAITDPKDETRGPRWFDPQRLDDPVLRTQRLIYERLERHFDLIRANSFAYEGE